MAGGVEEREVATGMLRQGQSRNGVLVQGLSEGAGRGIRPVFTWVWRSRSPRPRASMSARLAPSRETSCAGGASPRFGRLRIAGVDALRGARQFDDGKMSAPVEVG
jgi:hypothetical protein